MLSAMLLLPILAACGGPPPADTAAVEEEEEAESEREPCGELTIRVNGEDPPTVGDRWYMLLVCDGAVMTGALRVIWDPNDIAAVDETDTWTFLYAAEATLTMQAGSQRTSRAVTVLEAE